MAEEKKYRSVVVDTINGLQNSLFQKLMADKKTASMHDWKDFGLEILDLFEFVKTLPDTVIVLILGYEGTGKTVGASFLNPDETAIFNTDKKPLSFFGARQKYPVDNSKKNYKELSTYESVKAQLTGVHGKKKGTFVVFITGHIEDFKVEDTGVMRQRLKILGRMATKHGVEGLNTIHTYYTKVDGALPQNDPNRYKLLTMNSGLNTARSPQGYWDTYEIPNNYQMIVDKILLDYEGIPLPVKTA